MSVGTCAEKFIIVINDHGHMHKYNFSIFNQKFPFWANLVEKKKKKSNMQNSMVMFTFSIFDWNYLLGKFGPKNQNGQFKLKFGTETDLNM